MIRDEGQPSTLASGDFDGDGIQDLVVGYVTSTGGILSIQRGNLDAFAPQSSASLEGIGRGDFASPFLPDAITLSVPISPDFVAAGHFSGALLADIVVASRGGSSLYLLANDGRGGFADAQRIDVGGPITSLASGQFGKDAVYDGLLIGIGGKPGSYLMVYHGSSDGLKGLAVYPIPGALASAQFADLGDGSSDAAFLAGGQVFLLRSSTMQLFPVSVTNSGRAIALGSFLFDRNGGFQIAILESDGSVDFAVRNEFSPRAFTVEEFQAIRKAKRNGQQSPLLPQRSFPGNGWKIVESLPRVSTLAAGQAPLFFRTRISDHAQDDVMWLDASIGRMVVLSHPNQAPGAPTFLPAQLSVKPYAGNPIAALPLRVNIDNRPGIVALHRGATAPYVSMPLPDPTFYPNRQDDITPRGTGVTCLNTTGVDSSNDCTLREAILKANATSGTDTIHLEAKTYTLSIAKSAGDYSGSFGALYINDSVNIVGTSQTGTIIQAGTTSSNGVDLVMAVNEDINPVTSASASISNLTLQFGRNLGTHSNDGDGGCMEFDTGSAGTATLSLTNVTLQNCSTTQGEGGGIAIFNVTNPGSGFPTITNSIIQNNSAADLSASNVGAGGGGIWVSSGAKMSMSNSQVLTNNSTVVNGTGSGSGGGIFIWPGSVNSPQTTITGSTITGNKAAFEGGGVYTNANLSISTSTIANNVAGWNGSSSVAGAIGGGVYASTSSNGCPSACTDTTTITSTTITGNTATANGAGIYLGNGSGGGSLTMHFSRLASNTVGSTQAHLYNDHSTATVTNNWWGTNSPSGTITTTSGTTTFAPYAVLTHTAPAIQISQTAPLTASLATDSVGNTLSTKPPVSGQSITFNGASLGTISTATVSFNSSALATTNFVAGSTPGRGAATANFDQASVGVNSNTISATSETGSTVTITTVGAHNFTANQSVVISGVGVSGYNGTFTIASTPSTTTFTYTNPTTGLSSSSGGTATVGITINPGPPQITAGFGASPIPVNGTTTATFNISNPNSTTIHANFTDSLPTGLVVASTPGISNTCGGTVTAVAAASTISLSTTALPSGSCAISVNVTSSTDGTYSNSVQIQSSDAGTGNTSSANLTVINPPHVVKSFGASTMPQSGTTTLTISIDSNSNQHLALTGLAFTDSLPSGMAVASTPNVSNTCGGTPTAVAASGSVSLSGGSVAAGATCVVSVNVTGTSAGLKSNSVQVTSTNGGNSNTSTATVTVVSPPTISKAFGASSIPVSGTTTLTFTINNPNTTAAGDLTGVAFSDSLPNTTGTIVVAATPSVSNNCNGTVTANAGSGLITLSGGTVAHSSSCTLSVNVTGTAAGDAVNTTGAISSTEGGTGVASPSATVKVVAPPTISKAFGASSIPLNGTTTVTFTITNPSANTTLLSGIAFSDSLTNGLQVASTPSVSGVCNGTVTAAANSTSISLTGGSIATPGSTCTITVNVTGTQSGTVSNTTGAVASTNGGTGLASNTVTMPVVAPPSVNVQFSPTSIPVNGTSTLTINISNPNSSATLSGISFTDLLPSGLAVAATPNLTNTCGGTPTAVAASGSVSLSGATLAASASCAVSVNVTGTNGGQKSNSVQVSSTEGGSGNTSSATLTVVSPPTIGKAFLPTSIPVSGTSVLTFTINNPNTTSAGDLTGVAFSDSLPNSSGTIVVAATPGVSNNCNGTVTANAGSGLITLSGGTVAHNTSCTLSVNVTGTVAGSAANTTGAISSTEGGTGVASNTATLTIVAPPTIGKAFGSGTVTAGSSTTLTFTLGNPNSSSSLTGIGFSDTLPSGLVVSTPNGLSGSCGAGTITATAGSGSVSLSGGTLGATLSCTFAVNVTATAAGTQNNVTSNVVSNEGGMGLTASASTVVPPLAAVSVTPSSGTGSSQTFAFVFNDASGSSDINAVQAKFGTNPVSYATNCSVAYTPSSNTLYLMPDSGANWLGPVTLGSPGTIQNSQCSIDLGSSSANASGDNLTLNLAVTFKSGLTGAQNIYGWVQSASLQDSGWQSLGTWTASAASVLSATSVSPSSGSGSTQTFAFVYTDPNGSSDISVVQAMFSHKFTTYANNCSVAYIPSSNALYLMPDSGANWLGPVTVGSAGTIQNSQCGINLGSSSANASGNNLTLNLAVTFKSGLTGSQNIFGWVQNASSQNSGWQSLGTWTPSAANVLSAVSVTPSSGTGATQTFAFAYNDPSGGTDISVSQAKFGTNSVSYVSNCSTAYIRSSNQLYLMPDSGANWLGPATVGAAGTLSNSQCSIDLGSSSANVSGNTLTVNLAVTFQSGFTGTKSIFGWVQNAASQNSGWESLGSWTH